MCIDTVLLSRALMENWTKNANAFYPSMAREKKSGSYCYIARVPTSSYNAQYFHCIFLSTLFNWTIRLRHLKFMQIWNSTTLHKYKMIFGRIACSLSLFFFFLSFVFFLYFRLPTTNEQKIQISTFLYAKSYIQSITRCWMSVLRYVSYIWNLFDDPSNATIYYCGRLLISSTYVVRHIFIISVKVRYFFFALLFPTQNTFHISRRCNGMLFLPLLLLLISETSIHILRQWHFLQDSNDNHECDFFMKKKWWRKCWRFFCIVDICVPFSLCSKFSFLLCIKYYHHWPTQDKFLWNNNNYANPLQLGGKEKINGEWHTLCLCDYKWTSIRFCRTIFMEYKLWNKMSRKRGRKNIEEFYIHWPISTTHFILT